MNLTGTAGRLVAMAILAGGVVLLSGCGGAKHTDVPVEKNVVGMSADAPRAEKTAKAAQTTPDTQEAASQGAARLTVCQQELSILKEVSPEKYAIYKRKFDGLMGGAAQYAGLRNQVNPGIQETVDALYRYKVNRLCAEVGQVALMALVERGEQLK